MRAAYADLFACPDCRGVLGLTIADAEGGSVFAGALDCGACSVRYPIIRGIPRFVPPEQDYAGSFGWQWDRYRRTQIDEFSGTTASDARFRAETTWEPADIEGRLVLDAGCGAGRFTAVATSWGAEVVAVDMAAAAAEACSRNLKELGREALVVQASLLRLPFRAGTFANVFSLGVIQHTPDPELIMRLLPSLLQPGGRLAYWIYEERWTDLLKIRNALRHATRHLPVGVNFALSLALVTGFFPVSLAVSHVPGLRKALPLLPIASRHSPDLPLRQQFEWTLLDTLDWYSPAYEFRQKEEAVVRALRQAGVEDIHRTPARGMSVVGRMPAAPHVRPPEDRSASATSRHSSDDSGSRPPNGQSAR